MGQQRKLARALVNAMVSFGESDEDIAVNGYDRRNKERLVSHIAGILSRSARAELTQPEKDVLAQALSDYDEGIAENSHDYGEEEAEVLAFVEKHVSALERKLLS